MYDYIKKNLCNVGETLFCGAPFCRKVGGLPLTRQTPDPPLAKNGPNLFIISALKKIYLRYTTSGGVAEHQTIHTYKKSPYIYTIMQNKTFMKSYDLSEIEN